MFVKIDNGHIWRQNGVGPFPYSRIEFPFLVGTLKQLRSTRSWGKEVLGLRVARADFFAKQMKR